MTTRISKFKAPSLREIECGHDLLAYSKILVTHFDAKKGTIFHQGDIYYVTKIFLCRHRGSNGDSAAVIFRRRTKSSVFRGARNYFVTVGECSSSMSKISRSTAHRFKVACLGRVPCSLANCNTKPVTGPHKTLATILSYLMMVKTKSLTDLQT